MRAASVVLIALGLFAVAFASEGSSFNERSKAADKEDTREMYEGLNKDFGRTNKTHLTLAYRQVTRDQWAEAGVENTGEGEDEAMLAFGEIVMARDETPYMLELAKVVTSSTAGSTILEVGFGMAISAGFIQEQGCQKHVIIEVCVPQKLDSELLGQWIEMNPVTVSHMSERCRLMQRSSKSV